MPPAHLNYHHLQYFWAVAKEGNLTRTARRLRVAQSALSSQIRQLEEALGERLFERKGRKLVLTEAGRIAMSFADDIFTAGGQLLSFFRDGRHKEQTLRIGAVATLSRNFQESFVGPLLNQPDLKLCLSSGSLDELLRHLADHSLDLVLSNRPVQRGPERAWQCQRIARQKVSLIGKPRTEKFRFPSDLRSVSLLLPSAQSEIRNAFDTLCEQLEVSVRVLAEVDDMAMMRLLARDTVAVALLPSVVVRDELSSGTLQEYCVVPGLHEDFYAITAARRYQHPLIASLLARRPDQILAMG